jgi:hypothetical protein
LFFYIVVFCLEKLKIIVPKTQNRESEKNKERPLNNYVTKIEGCETKTKGRKDCLMTQDTVGFETNPRKEEITKEKENQQKKYKK